MSRMSAYGNPADDYIEDHLDLNEFLVHRPSATFFARAEGDSMINAGILNGAILVVDRSLESKQDDIIIAAVNGELTCKIFDARAQVLRSASPHYKPIPITEEMECVTLGVVVHAINQLCTRS